MLKKELEYLISKNGLDMKSDFLDPMMHIEMRRIGKELPDKLKEHDGEQIVVFYGCCHPHMDSMVETAHAHRMDGLNCFEMLLGKELYASELANGAYFLLEGMALDWDVAMQKSFGGNMDVAREIFKDSSKYMLMIKTPLSSDFTKEAQKAGDEMGLPLREMSVELHNLEKLLLETTRMANDS